MFSEKIDVVTVSFRPDSTYLAITTTNSHDYQPTHIIDFGDPMSLILFDGEPADLITALAKLTKPHSVALHPNPQTYGVSTSAEFTAK